MRVKWSIISCVGGWGLNYWTSRIRKLNGPFPQSACPVTVQQWCGYCRFKTCLTTKGFRFFTEASTKHLVGKQQGPERKRKYSGKGVYKELNFVSDSIAADNINIPAVINTELKELHEVEVYSSTPVDESVFVKPGSQTGPSYHQATDQTAIAAYYDGSSLGLTNEKKSPGLLNDPSKVAWVMQQQEKYLKHHLDLFNRRRNRGRQ